MQRLDPPTSGVGNRRTTGPLTRLRSAHRGATPRQASHHSQSTTSTSTKHEHECIPEAVLGGRIG